MNDSEWFFTLGPLSILKVGLVWAIDLGRYRVFGLGWTIRGYGRLPK